MILKMNFLPLLNDKKHVLWGITSWTLFKWTRSRVLIMIEHEHVFYWQNYYDCKRKSYFICITILATVIYHLLLLFCCSLSNLYQHAKPHLCKCPQLLACTCAQVLMCHRLIMMISNKTNLLIRRLAYKVMAMMANFTFHLRAWRAFLIKLN